MQRIKNHVYIQMKNPTKLNLSETPLGKVPKNFFHWTSDKLFNLICRAQPDEATLQTQKAIQEISASCDLCQRVQIGPKRSSVALGSDSFILNQGVLLDTVYIDKRPILLSSTNSPTTQALDSSDKSLSSRSGKFSSVIGIRFTLDFPTELWWTKGSLSMTR